MLFYNLGIFFYRLLIGLLSPFHAKARKMLEGRKDLFLRLEQFSKTRTKAPLIWFHAASLGEFEQGRPVIEALRKKYPQAKVLLTFFSPSGFEVQKNYPGADVITYIPFDFSSDAKKFLDLVNPDIAVFIKYEFWLNFISELHKRKIPLYLLAAVFHPAQPFFKWYGGAFRKAIKTFTHIFVQDKQSAELLQTLHVPSFSLSGDTRYDRVVQVKENRTEIMQLSAFCNEKFTIVLGSSYKTEEEMCCELFADLKTLQPQLNLLIAPHEINTSNISRIKNLLGSSSIAATTFTEATSAAGSALVLDTMGMLSAAYRYGKIAVIGGGFGSGIHNILEAAVYGLPVIFGPNYSKYTEANEMIAEGCAFTFSNKTELNTILQKLLSDKEYYTQISSRASEFVVQRAGVTEAVVKKIRLPGQ